MLMHWFPFTPVLQLAKNCHGRALPSTLTPVALAQDAGRRQLQVVTTDDLVPGFETGRDALSVPYVLPVLLMSLAFRYFEQLNRPSHALTSKDWTKCIAHAKQVNVRSMGNIHC